MANENRTFIDTLFVEQRDLIAFLREQGQLSFSLSAEEIFRKTLLLSVASYFESRIAAAITDFAGRVSNSDEALTSLIRVKAIERQYHSYFQWREGKRSVAPFFGMFGSSLKDLAKKELRADELKNCSEAFLELGDLRNLLVHENFASFPLEKTAEEIYLLYQAALGFVNYVEEKLNPSQMQTAETT